MKVSLVQLDAGTDWRHEELADWLAQAPPADLVVFPESYPFWRSAGINHRTAIARLEAAAQQHPERSFIAGGYVADEGHDSTRILRNRSYLVHGGHVVDTYDKQVVFQNEQFCPGQIVKLFAWGAHRCLPLICADADTGPEADFMASLVRRARAAGAGPGVPIIVSSFGAMLTEPYWTESLHHLANTLNASVLICGIAGTSTTTFIYSIEDGGDGKRHPYGGGGSGLFIPNKSEPKQYTEPGFVTVDLDTLQTRWRAFR
ncbi:hypothetical protein [Ideonella margarita]|uniref:CN hydrolase domain-containing protein n=1 Tax=Ideonella margarita TaxID=2984191 RepID=A0ABU9C6Z3_9BURK